MAACRRLQASDLRKCELQSEDKLVGQKPPLKLNDIWTIRIRL
jgi:hypothetical protein